MDQIVEAEQIETGLTTSLSGTPLQFNALTQHREAALYQQLSFAHTDFCCFWPSGHNST